MPAISRLPRVRNRPAVACRLFPVVSGPRAEPTGPGGDVSRCSA